MKSLTGDVARRQVTIVNPQGLHARPADLFARMASGYRSHIEIVKDGARANGKSILDILMLAAVYGTELTIEARGEDAERAVGALGDLLEGMLSADPLAD